MKNIKSVSILILLLGFLPHQSVQASQNQIKTQINQLTTMLIECNDSYIHKTLPIYKEPSYYQWVVSWFFPGYYYNRKQSEMILTEAERIAALIVVMQKMQANK
ncbi:hypothetical protein KBC04_02815 [Candidatus Babeliales bacterium]|nr:hypothetical protein [Candidatus Babeliales bacterium]MBP9844015.1 hypothetical protein [Candidatus Babeliales bacterium]